MSVVSELGLFYPVWLNTERRLQLVSRLAASLTTLIVTGHWSIVWLDSVIHDSSIAWMSLAMKFCVYIFVTDCLPHDPVVWRCPHCIYHIRAFHTTFTTTFMTSSSCSVAGISSSLWSKLGCRRRRRRASAQLPENIAILSSLTKIQGSPCHPIHAHNLSNV